jgi:CRP/FNR family transcriptional regulator, nitrogen fixation regulation protein
MAETGDGTVATQERSVAMNRFARACEPRDAIVALEPTASPQKASLAFDALALITHYQRHQEISNGETANFWYRVIRGAAKRCSSQPNGRRQIVDLLLPGDFFGFGPSREGDFIVEALVDGTQIARYPRRRVEALADTNPAIARLIRDLAFAAISRLEVQLLIVGRITALEKVAAFLLEIGERLAHERTDKITLPISRGDMADFLAISVETVSRSLSGLKHRGLIRFISTRQLNILDRETIEFGECRARK